ncbi:MAG TPA: MoaD/ThiS family protein [Candidatus Bathyarchaeia archaeon]|nr:MoaD/ThiS family protein [Candidatus Bathyarchaeia archaeon]
MISVRVNAYGIWQMLLGAKSKRVKIAGNTLQDLIEKLNDNSGILKREVLSSDGKLDPKLKIFVNGVSHDDLSNTLKDGDDVILFAVIDGGAS